MGEQRKVKQCSNNGPWPSDQGEGDDLPDAEDRLKRSKPGPQAGKSGGQTSVSQEGLPNIAQTSDPELPAGL
eukprot:5114893-Prorocentrum_lima.AAC.1